MSFIIVNDGDPSFANCFPHNTGPTTHHVDREALEDLSSVGSVPEMG